MGFFSFLGRLLFASIFIISAWQLFNDFGEDGGPAAKELALKLGKVKELVFTKFGVKFPDIEARQLVATSLALKGLGGILFVFRSTFGAYLLILYLAFTTPFLYDFYNYDPAQPEFSSTLKEFLQNVALFGALLFFLGMKNAMPRRQLKKAAPKRKAA